MKPLWLFLPLVAAIEYACPPIDAAFKAVAIEHNKTVACRCQERGFYNDVNGVTVECSDSSYPMLKDSLAQLNKTEVERLKIWSSTLFKLTDDFFKNVIFKHLSIIDCELGSVTDKAFAPIAKNLVSLTLKGNQLNSKILSLLRDFPKLQILDLSGNTINGITKNTFPDDLKELSLDMNQIRTVEDGSFANLRTLRRLTMSKNQIEQITATTFKGLDQVENLILNHNHIQNIDYTAFANMKKLRVLDLGANDIPGVELRSLPKLQKVYLNNNNIFSFKEIVLKDLPSLILVSMDRNFVAEIEDGDLAGLSKSVKLESLTLAANNISRIGSKAFAPIQHVSILALQNNQLELLSEENSQSFLTPLFRLKTLLLSNNNLKLIRANDLPRSLNTLAADHNKLEEIETNSFTNIQMQRIYLNDNRLTHLPLHIFDSFDMEEFEAADITGNRWFCVCGKEWLIDWLNNLGDKDVGEGVVGCLAIPECGLAASERKEEEEAEARRSAWISIGATLLAVASIAILLIIAFMFITEGKHTTIFLRPKKVDSDMHKLIADTDHPQEAHQPVSEELPTISKRANGEAKKSVRFADA